MKRDFTEFCYFLYLQTYFWRCVLCMAVQVRSRKEGGIQLLTSLTPSSQIEGSVLRTLSWKSHMEKFSKLWVLWFHFNVKINYITFGQTHLAKSKFDKVGFYLEEILSVFFLFPIFSLFLDSNTWSLDYELRVPTIVLPPLSMKICQLTCKKTKNI